MPLAIDRAPAYLVPLAGPAVEQFVLLPDRSPLTLGRHESCDLATPEQEERISRFHAQFHFTGDQWFVTDLKSTWGTFLNGYRIPPDIPHALSEGDLLRMTPWTFSFRHQPVRAGLISSSGELQGNVTVVRSISPTGTPHDAGTDPLAMLVEAVAGLHQASDEASLATLVVDLARRGTGYSNAAYLRPADADGAIEVIASSSPDAQGLYSRSLLAAAAGGNVAVLDSSMRDTAQSIIALNIQNAICIPLMLGQSVAGYLYLDTRGGPGGRTGRPARIHPRASDFCLALGRVASLALANLKRIEIEHRQAAALAELQQAAAVQQYLLPPRVQEVSGIRVIGESRPGQFLGGDFLDVIPLEEGRVAVVLGDVSGKGIIASVLMTTIHGFLHATLAGGTPVAEAVCRLNDFLAPRSSDERFATLLCAEINTKERTLTFVDAGHGYGMLWDEQTRTLQRLQQEGGPPLGLFPGFRYEPTSVPLSPGGAVLIVSDGIVEQPIGRGESRRQFEISGIEAALKAAAPETDLVQQLFAAVEMHAGGKSLADDATVLLATW